MKAELLITSILLTVLIYSCKSDNSDEIENAQIAAAKSDGILTLVSEEDISIAPHSTRVTEVFGTYTDGYNCFILEAIDKVQSTAPDGGGYFASVSAVPPETPIGYPLSLFGNRLFEPQRKTSYCSGSSYAVFIETMNMIFPDGAERLTEDRLESLNIVEKDGGRREDNIKFWGKWNDDGFGNHFALVQYSRIGRVIEPRNARPGDFMNISWKSGNGHSVVFLGWHISRDGKWNVVYWASQKSTNGLGIGIASLDRIKNVMIVRVTDPENLFTFDPSKETKRNIEGMTLNF